MPRIDFFDERYKQTTNKKEFGLRDDLENQPAYIDELLSNKKDKWFGTIINNKGKEVLFYPVDHCIILKRADDNDALKCEGIIRYDSNKLIFTELKKQNIHSDWRKDGEEQIKETLHFFFDNYNKNDFKIKAWICNKKQLTDINYHTQIKAFREETQVLFKLKYKIDLNIQREINV